MQPTVTQPGIIQTNNNDFERQVKEVCLKVIKEYLKTQAFTERKLTDTPTDGLQVVNRNYVNQYASVATAPKSSVIGQQVFATDLGYPIFKHQNSRWVNGVGSIVG